MSAFPAHDATKLARTATDHKNAAIEHRKAAKAQAGEGNADTADYHRMMAQYHDSESGKAAGEKQHAAIGNNLNKVAKADSADAMKKSAAAIHTDKPEDHEAAANAHEKAKTSNSGAGNTERAAKHGAMAESHRSFGMGRMPMGMGATRHAAKKPQHPAHKAADAGADAALSASARATMPLECYGTGADAFRSYPAEDGSILYMPAGINTLTPSQGGVPVTVTLDVVPEAASLLEAQRVALTAKNKKPPFSVTHEADIAAFWPSKFSWDTRVDATGKMVTGVWADGTWTGEGKRHLEEKNFRAFSPTFHVDAVRNDPANPCHVINACDPKWGKYCGANMGALVNDPAFQRMSPLWCRNAQPAQQQEAAKAAVLQCSAALGMATPLADVLAAVQRNFGIGVTSDEARQYLNQ